MTDHGASTGGSRGDSPVFRVAVLGTGFAQRVQLPGFASHPRFRPVAVAGRSPASTEAVARRFELQTWSTDWSEMLAEGFDVVSIVTPPHLHLPMVTAALETGAHVLVEKPLALNVAEAEAMVAAAEAAKRTVMVNHEFRFLPARQRFGELVADGYLGDLHRVVWRSHAAHRADPNRLWGWWSDAERGGGLIGALGSHAYDGVRHWFGDAERVWAKLSTHVTARRDSDGTERPVTADDAFIAVASMASGGEALFDCTATARAARGSKVMAYGSSGSLIIDDDGRLLGARGDGDFTELPLEALAKVEADEPWLLGPFRRLLDKLARGIDTGASPSPNLGDGIAHQAFLDAARRSDREGGWVAL